MQKKQPTKKQWKQLFQLSKTIYKLQPWKYIPENLVFGVQLTDINTYVSFIGQLGETMGVIAYLGENAINKIKHMNCPETLINTPMLSLTFDSTEELEEVDEEIADWINFYWEDTGFCPSFRVNEPGYFPWTFNRQNCEKFIIILQQTIKFIKGRTDFSNLLDINAEYKNCPFRQKQADGTWVSKTLNIPPFNNLLIEKPSEEVLNEIRKLPIVTETIQAGCLILPTPIGEEDRPKVGYFFMLIDEKTKQIIAHDLFSKEPGEPTVIEKIFSILAEEKIRPMNIVISEDNLLHDFIQELQPIDLPVQVVYKESAKLFDKLVLELFNDIDEEYDESEDGDGHSCGCSDEDGLDIEHDILIDSDEEAHIFKVVLSKNPDIYRKIAIAGNQTLEIFGEFLFDVFLLEEDLQYSFSIKTIDNEGDEEHIFFSQFAFFIEGESSKIDEPTFVDEITIELLNIAINQQFTCKIRQLADNPLIITYEGKSDRKMKYLPDLVESQGFGQLHLLLEDDLDELDEPTLF